MNSVFFTKTQKISADSFYLRRSLSVYMDLFLFVYRRHHGNISFQHIRRAVVIAFFLIHIRDFFHFFFFQLKIKEIKVVSDMIRILGSRNYNISILDMPAQDNLRAGLLIFFSQFHKQRLLDQSLISMSERIPCLDHNFFFFQEFF